MKYLFRLVLWIMPVMALAFGPQKEIDRLHYRGIDLGPLGAYGKTQYDADHILIDSVEPGFSASVAGLQKNDVVTAVKVFDLDTQFRDFPPELSGDVNGGAGPRQVLGEAIDDALATDSRKIVLRVVRDADLQFYVEDATLKMQVIGGTLIPLEITLPDMPSLKESWPFNDDESKTANIELITEDLCDYIAAKVAAGWHRGGNNYITWSGWGLSALISSGKQKYHKAIRSIADNLIEVYSDENYENWTVPKSNWHVSYIGYALCEYYAATGDRRAIAPIKNVMRFICRTTPIEGVERGRHGHGYRQNHGYAYFHPTNNWNAGLNAVTTTLYTVMTFAHYHLGIDLEGELAETRRYTDEYYEADHWSYDPEITIGSLRYHMGRSMGWSTVNVNGTNVGSWHVGYYDGSSEWDAGMRGPQHAAGLIFEADEWLNRDYSDYPDMDGNGAIDSSNRRDSWFDNLKQRRAAAIRFSKIKPGMAFACHAQTYPGPFWAAQVLRWAKTNEDKPEFVEADITAADRSDAAVYEMKRIDNGYESFMRYHRWWFTLSRAPQEYNERHDRKMFFIGGKGNTGGDGYLGLKNNAHTVPTGMLAAYTGKLQLHGNTERNWFRVADVDENVAIDLYEKNDLIVPLKSVLVQRGQEAVLTFNAPKGKKIASIHASNGKIFALPSDPATSVTIREPNLTASFEVIIELVDWLDPQVFYSCDFEAGDGFDAGNSTLYGGEPITDVKQGRWTPVTLADHDGTNKVISKMFWSINGTAISNLTESSRYPNQFSATRVMDSLSYSSLGNNYASETVGFLMPDVTGSYTFYLNADDTSQFWLSTDQSEANLTQLVEVTSWRSNWLEGSTVNLVAGQKYFFKVLHKEGGGGDHVHVGWRKPGNTAVEVISGTYIQSIVPFNGGNACYVQSNNFNNSKGLKIPDGAVMQLKLPNIAAGNLSFEVKSADATNFGFELTVYLGALANTPIIDRSNFEVVYQGNHQNLDEVIIPLNLTAAELDGRALYFAVNKLTDGSSAGLFLDNLSIRKEDPTVAFVRFDLGAYGSLTSGKTRQFVSIGEAAVEPMIRVEPGYTFTGWNRQFDQITENSVITAQYERKSYQVTFSAGSHGTFDTPAESEQIVLHGEAPVEPSLSVDTGWRFTEWENWTKAVTTDVSMTAQYRSAQYEVKVVTDSGLVLDSTLVEPSASYSYEVRPGIDGVFVDSIAINGQAEIVDVNQKFGPYLIELPQVLNDYNIVISFGNTRRPDAGGATVIDCSFEPSENFSSVTEVPVMDEVVTDDEGNDWTFDGSTSMWADGAVTDIGALRIPNEGYVLLTANQISNGISDIEFNALTVEAGNTYFLRCELGDTNGWSRLGEVIVNGNESLGSFKLSLNLDNQDLQGQFIRFSVYLSEGQSQAGLYFDDFTAYPLAQNQTGPFTVVFDGGEFGRVDPNLAVQEIAAGAMAVTPEVTVSNPSVTFTGWNKSIDAVYHDQVITALYNQPTYTVTFNLGENGLSELTETDTIQVEVPAGNPVTGPVVEGVVTTVDSGGKTFVTGGWQFVGWDQPLHAINSDLVVNAVYIPAPKDVSININGPGYVTAGGVKYDENNQLLKTDSAGVFHFTVTPISGYQIASIASSDGYYYIPQDTSLPYSDSFVPGNAVTFTVNFTSLEESPMVVDCDFGYADGFYDSGRQKVERAVDRLQNIWEVKTTKDGFSGVYSDNYDRGRVVLLRTAEQWNETSLVLSPETRFGWGTLQFDRRKSVSHLDWDLRVFVGNDLDGWQLMANWRNTSDSQWMTGVLPLNLSEAQVMGQAIKVTARLLSSGNVADNAGIILDRFKLSRYNPLNDQSGDHIVEFILGEHLELTSGSLKQLVVDGGAAVEPNFTIEPGFEFVGWSFSPEVITTNVSIEALVSPISHHVEFKVSAADTGKAQVADRLLITQTIEQGQFAKDPGVTVLDETLRFSGWSESLGPIGADTVIFATFEDLGANLPPEFTVVQATYPQMEGSPVSIAVEITDEQVVTLTTNVNWLQVTSLGDNRFVIGGTLPAVVADQTFELLLTATDSDNVSTNHKIQQAVVNLNEAPQLISGRLNGVAVKGFPLLFEIQANDADLGDKIVFSATGLPNGLRLNSLRDGFAEIAGVPTVSGSYAVIVTATDHAGAEDTATYNLNINDFTYENGFETPQTVEDLALQAGKIRCVWTAFPNAKQYRLKVSENSSFSPAKIYNAGQSLEMTLSNLSPGSNYFTLLQVEDLSGNWYESAVLELSTGYFSTISSDKTERMYPARRWSMHNNINNWNDGSETRFKIYNVTFKQPGQLVSEITYSDGRGTITANDWISDLSERTLTWQLEAGTSSEVEVELRDGDLDGVKQHRVAIWVDFNADGLFDESEFFESSKGDNEPHKISIQVPDHATYGPTLLRLRSAHQKDGSPLALSAYGLDNGGHNREPWPGPAQDFMVRINPPSMLVNDDYFHLSAGVNELSVLANDIVPPSANVTWDLSGIDEASLTCTADSTGRFTVTPVSVDKPLLQQFYYTMSAGGREVTAPVTVCYLPSTLNSGEIVTGGGDSTARLGSSENYTYVYGFEKDPYNQAVVDLDGNNQPDVDNYVKSGYSNVLLTDGSRQVLHLSGEALFRGDSSSHLIENTGLVSGQKDYAIEISLKSNPNGGNRLFGFYGNGGSSLFEIFRNSIRFGSTYVTTPDNGSDYQTFRLVYKYKSGRSGDVLIFRGKQLMLVAENVDMNWTWRGGWMGGWNTGGSRCDAYIDYIAFSDSALIPIPVTAGNASFNVSYSKPIYTLELMVDEASIGSKVMIRQFIDGRWAIIEQYTINEAGQLNFEVNSLSGNEEFRVDIVAVNGAMQTLYPNVDGELIRLDFAKGWNLFSVPLSSAKLEHLLEINRNLWFWDGSAYQPTQSIQAGEGVWLESSGLAVDIPVRGYRSNANQAIDLQPGWNLIGAYSNAGTMLPEGDYIVYRWDPIDARYVEEPDLREILPTKAYWVYHFEEINP